MFNQIGTYFSHLFSLSMFGLPVWALVIIMIATATIVAFAIMLVAEKLGRSR